MRQGHRGLHWILGLALLGLAALDAWGPGLLHQLDHRISDAMLRREAAHPAPDPDIVIVYIDESSLHEMNEAYGEWPWPRTVFAECVEGLERFGPKAILIDKYFSERDSHGEAHDARLNAALAAGGNVYLPMRLLDGEASSPFPMNGAVAEALRLEATPQAKVGAPIALELPHEHLHAIFRRGGVGLVSFDYDGDGMGRRYALYRDVEGWRIPSLPARVAKDLGYALPAQDLVIHWRGPALAFSHLRFSDLYAALRSGATQVQLLEGDVGRRVVPLESLRGKILLLGASAPGLVDFHPTPMGSRFPGVEIMATVLDNVKQGRALHPVPGWALAALTALIVLAVSGAFAGRLSPLSIGFGLAIVSAALVAAAQALLGRNILLPLGTPLGAAWLTAWASGLVAFLRERKARAQATLTFGRFLDPRVVETLVDEGATTQTLSGKTREITVLFSDIRGFTTLSEQAPAAEVVELLNRYFTLQAEAIFQHRGTLDKYIGDCIMAFWDAPQDDPEHAVHAVDAALEMVVRLERFKAEAGPLGQNLDIGIGIHTGQAVVGFIGSERHLDYTIIGDTVNLGSRIEGLTKGLARVLVSEETKRHCGDRFAFEDLGWHAVKGRQQPVHLFAPRRQHEL